MTPNSPRFEGILHGRRGLQQFFAVGTDFQLEPENTSEPGLGPENPGSGSFEGEDFFIDGVEGMRAIMERSSAGRFMLAWCSSDHSMTKMGQME